MLSNCLGRGGAESCLRALGLGRSCLLCLCTLAGTPASPCGRGIVRLGCEAEPGAQDSLVSKRPLMSLEPALAMAPEAQGQGGGERVCGCDPESQRKRTVQNVLDLRQNLEETMSSLRGSQVSHSSLEMTCYDSDEANPRSVSSLSNRSSPLSWRYGQSSPRLQAGDAPSVGGSCRSEGTPSWYMHGERAHYSHTMPMRSPSKLSHISRLELVESLDTDDVELKSGYMSDSDLMGKTLTEDDDITTGSLEMTCYDSDEANPRSVSSLSNRSSPLSWRYGQSSPRLQAGDAPSVGGSCRSEGTPSWYMHGERAHYSHTMPMRSPSKLSHISRLELVESLDTDDVELKSGYMSDSDLMGKTLTEDDDITTGWDESSSISSGLSDASDNLSSEEFNASSSLNSLPSTPTASRRNSAIALRTDSEKRSLAESGLSWYGEAEDKASKKLDYDSSSLKMEHGSSKWRREPSESCEEVPKGGELKKPVSLGTPGSLKKGKTPPVAVTSPITHTAQSTLKVAGKPETKATDKSKLSVKNTGLQRSSSDAGRDRTADAKKPPSGLTRPSASSSFGYKKPAPTTGTATVMQAGGSATLGKIQKSSGIPVKPVSGRKTSLDVSNAAEPGFLAPGARSNIQYRSLPRPAKSSSMSVTGGRGANRPVSSSIDPSLLSTKQGSISVWPPWRELGGCPVYLASVLGNELRGSSRPSLRISPGWDESSSISSGLSDASDNLSSEEFNASSSLNSLPSTPTASRRNSAIALRTDSEKRSLAESGLSWYGEAEDKASKKLDYDSSSLKMEHGSSKWRREPSESCEEVPKGGELKKPVSLGTPGSLKKGKTPPVAVTSPITHTAQSTLKVAGKPETKATDKSKLSVKNTGLQRSSSDAGRDRTADAKKPPSGLTRPSASSSFGYKKPAPTTGTATVMQAGGSATLGKIQKSSGIPVKPVSGRKTSLDVSNAAEPGFLAPGARSNIQYRSLPRPAKSSSMSVTGGRGANRPVSSSIDPSLLSTKQGSISVSRLKEPSKIGAGRGTPAPVNQTDREKEKAKAKAVALDSECVTLKNIGSPESTPKAQANLPPAAKVAELPPTPLRAAAKTYVKPPSLANLDKVNSNSLDLPSSSELHPPHTAKLQDLHPAGGHLTPCFSPSPAPILNINSASFSQGLELMGGFSVPKEGRMYPKLSGLHRSMESLQMPMSLPSAFSGGSTPAPAPAAVPPASTEEEEEAGELGWSGSPRLAHLDSTNRDRNTLPKKGLRYQLHSQEEAKERRHSHTIGGLPESDDQPELPSPPALSVALVGKGPLTSIVSPTAATTPRITRSNSIPTHDSTFELYSTSQMGSTLSLADKPKGMIRSGSFRDPVDDVHGSVLSLASSASSTYSSAEEKMQSEPMMQHYISLLLKHRRLILSGPSGTGKTYLTNRLAEYLVERSGRDVTEGIVSTFNMHQQSCKDLQLYLSNLANQIDRETGTADVPLVILLDDLSEAGSISELVNGALTCKYHKCPYIIGTTNQPVKMTPNHGLHLSFRGLLGDEEEVVTMVHAGPSGGRRLWGLNGGCQAEAKAQDLCGRIAKCGIPPMRLETQAGIWRPLAWMR
nr:PREDICTED: neuron navigator 1 [Apteryx mantelli mantelli]